MGLGDSEVLDILDASLCHQMLPTKWARAEFMTKVLAGLPDTRLHLKTRSAVSRQSYSSPKMFTKGSSHVMILGDSIRAGKCTGNRIRVAAPWLHHGLPYLTSSADASSGRAMVFNAN